jgi:acyl carrier protein
MRELSETEIRGTVLEVVADLAGRDVGSIPLDARLVRDLKIDSDDLSFVLVPELSKRFSASVPVHVWDRVYTVGDVVRVFMDLTSTREQPPSRGV